MKVIKVRVSDEEMDVNAAKKMPFVKKAIASAKSAISWFEKEYPRDKKPRKAIEAAEAWMKNPTEKNRMKAILADSAAYSSASAANFDTYESASAASASHAAEAAGAASAAKAASAASSAAGAAAYANS